MSTHVPCIRRRHSGFTLVELLVTMSVLGILLAVALPNLRNFVVGNRLSSNVNGFIGLLNYARSEAIVRNQSVIVCPKNNTTNACVNSQFWGEYEIQAFVDLDGSGTWSTGDVRLKTLPAMDPTSNEFAFVRPAGVGSIKFRAIGMSQVTHRFDLHVVTPGDTAYEFTYGRSVCISKPGRARVIAYSANQCDVF